MNATGRGQYDLARMQAEIRDDERFVDGGSRQVTQDDILKKVASRRGTSRKRRRKRSS